MIDKLKLFLLIMIFLLISINKFLDIIFVLHPIFQILISISWFILIFNLVSFLNTLTNFFSYEKGVFIGIRNKFRLFSILKLFFIYIFIVKVKIKDEIIYVRKYLFIKSDDFNTFKLKNAYISTTYPRLNRKYVIDLDFILFNLIKLAGIFILCIIILKFGILLK